MKIWSYRLKPLNKLYHDFNMPVGAEVLTIEVVQDVPVIYARINEDMELQEQRQFAVVGTGHEIPNENWPCLGTAVLGANTKFPLVLHVFEVTE